MDAPSRDEAQNGLYLVIGSTADNISLWKVKDGKKELLIAGVEKILDNSAPSAAIRVTRFKGGETILETDLGEGYREEGRARVEGFESQYFGVASVYTATRSKLFGMRISVYVGRLLPTPFLLSLFHIKPNLMLWLSQR